MSDCIRIAPNEREITLASVVAAGSSIILTVSGAIGTTTLVLDEPAARLIAARILGLTQPAIAVEAA